MGSTAVRKLSRLFGRIASLFGQKETQKVLFYLFLSVFGFAACQKAEAPAEMAPQEEEIQAQEPSVKAVAQMLKDDFGHIQLLLCPDGGSEAEYTYYIYKKPFGHVSAFMNRPAYWRARILRIFRRSQFSPHQHHRPFPHSLYGCCPPSVLQSWVHAQARTP